VRLEAASGGGLDLGSNRRQGREESEATGNSAVGGGELDLMAKENAEQSEADGSRAAVRRCDPGGTASQQITTL
jgi:hypothetical protein